MKIAFISESTFTGKYPNNFTNARTEIAWQITLDADHHNISTYPNVTGYDHVFIIFPKGRVFLSAEGSKIFNGINPVSELLRSNIVSVLKQNNTKVHFIQEGPHWWFNDYEIQDQIYFYNLISQCDSIFAHNEYDVNYYKGLFPNKPIQTIGTLMLEHLIEDIHPIKDDKVIIGGNFSHWYGGFESYIIASQFELPIWGQTSHATRDYENQIVNLTHLPRLDWLEWMKALSEFKYAVHLMPTVAAGTFSLNCAYFGVPCIGNELVDTQRLCHPLLSVDVSDLDTATKLAIRLRDDTEFYNECSSISKENYQKYYSLDVWKDNMKKYLV